MSNEFLRLAWKTRLRKGAKTVLIVLADAANDDGVCWPSRAVIAEQAGCAQSTVSRHLKDLINLGVVTQTRSRRRSASYRLDRKALRLLQDVPNQDVSIQDISDQDVSNTPVKTSQIETSLKGTLIDPSNTSAIADEHPEARKLCERLVELMVANGCTKPAIGQRWLDAARLLLDKDGRTFELALAVLEWSQADRFWRANIRSMPKFRDQFDQLRLQAEGRGELAPPVARLETADAARDWLRGEWRAGRFAEVEKRTRITFHRPDIPPNVRGDAAVAEFYRDAVRTWIDQYHNEIIAALTGGTP